MFLPANPAISTANAAAKYRLSLFNSQITAKGENMSGRPDKQPF